MSRREMVEALAPVAPPCFASRIDWREYLTAAAEAQSEKGQPAPLIFEAGKPVRFNTDFDFCHDCDPMHAVVKERRGKCKPDWLKTPPKPLLQLVKEFVGA